MLLVAIVLLGGVYGLLYLFQPPLVEAPSPTSLPIRAKVQPSPSPVASVPANWQLYTSPALGFTIMYPPDVEHETTVEGERFIKFGPSQSLGTELYDGISLVIRSGSYPESTFADAVEQKYRAAKNDPIQSKVSNLRPIELAGKSGFAFDVSSLGDRTYMYPALSPGTYLEIIDASVEPASRPQIFAQTVATMLSTLSLK